MVLCVCSSDIWRFDSFPRHVVQRCHVAWYRKNRQKRRIIRIGYVITAFLDYYGFSPVLPLFVIIIWPSDYLSKNIHSVIFSSVSIHDSHFYPGSQHLEGESAPRHHIDSVAIGENKHRSKKKKKFLDSCDMYIDRLHQKTHTRPMCLTDCNITSRMDLVDVDTMICEQTNSWLKQYLNILRNFSGERSKYYYLFVFHLLNCKRCSLDPEQKSFI